MREAGCAGSIEYAISEDRMTEEGELWEPDEEDPTLDRHVAGFRA